MNTQEQFLKAYDELADAIFRHCYFRVYNRERAEDLMQEAFCRTWQYLAEGKTIDNLRAFIYRVANNLVIDDVRKRKEASLDALQSEGFSPVDAKAQAALVAGVELRELKHILEGIDPGYREVITMRYLEDLQPREIATILHETENAVSVRLHRGIKKVQDLFIDGR